MTRFNATRRRPPSEKKRRWLISSRWRLFTTRRRSGMSWRPVFFGSLPVPERMTIPRPQGTSRNIRGCTVSRRDSKILGNTTWSPFLKRPDTSRLSGLISLTEFISPKKTFLAAGGIPEFQNWGGEDEILYDKVAQISRVERFKHAGLDHQWHPISCRHEYHRGESHEDFRKYRVREISESRTDL